MQVMSDGLPDGRNGLMLAGKPRIVSKTIVILAFDGITTSDVVGPIDVFHLVEKHAAAAGVRYDIVLASIVGGPIRSSSGIELSTKPLAEVETGPIDTLIVPGGGPPDDPPCPPDAVAWLRRNRDRPERFCAVCTGIFLVAEAGIARGLHVTTHWQACQAFASRYPDIRLDANPVFVRDGNLWTSAGFTAGLDMVLALIQDDLGHEAAIGVARSLVMYLKRPGGQPQLSAPITSQSSDNGDFSALHAWMVEHLNEDIRIERLACQAGMSMRTFARRYIAKVGRTPGTTLDLFRIEAAFRQMIETGLTLKDIAGRTGFGNEQNLRRTFLRHFGVLPREYRGNSPAVTAPRRDRVRR